MKKLLYIALVLCTPLSKLHSQSYINSIEHGVYIDNHLTYPYTQLAITFNQGLFVEAGMLDLPSSININFNNTVQNKAGRLSYLINNMEEPVSYNGAPREPEWYYFIGTSLKFNKYRIVLESGATSRSSLAAKISQYYRVLNTEGAFIDLGLHTQFCSNRSFFFFGYSWGVDLDPIR